MAHPESLSVGRAAAGVLLAILITLAETVQAGSERDKLPASPPEVYPGSPVERNKEALPRVMSTNLCADMLLLGLADDSQITSLSHQSQDPQRSSLAVLASRFPANHASAEEIIMQQPDIVLASRRWQSLHRSDLFERFNISVVNVPFPKDWPGMFSSLRQIGELIGRSEQAERIIGQTQQRLDRIHPAIPDRRVLYLRGNGGTAATGTYIDALLQGLNAINQATVYGLEGWSHVSLESILLAPPDAFLVSQTQRDVSPGRGGLYRHPLLRQSIASRPVLTLSNLDSGCSNWRQIETVEGLAQVLDQHSFEPASEERP